LRDVVHIHPNANSSSRDTKHNNFGGNSHVVHLVQMVEGRFQDQMTRKVQAIGVDGGVGGNHLSTVQILHINTRKINAF
jgi:hypothetical protein